MNNQDLKQQDSVEQENTNKILEEKISELENNWKRALADYKNLQKRAEEERLDLVLYANQNLIYKLLFIMDSLNMLESHLDDAGLKIITKEFRQILKEEGVEEIDPTGSMFDETQMDAIDVVDGKTGQIMNVTQKGYKYKNKILRPAKVKVGKEGGN